MIETAPERIVNTESDIGRHPYGAGMALSDHEGRSVLVVDDEPMVREVVSRYLERDGLDVEEATDGPSALAALERKRPDLVVLDVMLPGLDGYALLARLRAETDVPVIMLTARNDESDRILGLEMGADDYVVKPFSPRELAARVRAVLKRSARPRPNPDPILEVGELRIDPGSRDVTFRGRMVDLKPKEFDLLWFLASNPRQVFSRAQLLEQVWESNSAWQDPSTVTVHIRRVRKAIEPDPADPRYLITIWGVGYRFEP